MSKITKIQIQKLNKSKFNIFVDEEYKLSVSQESLIRLNLKVGMQFDETEILLEENKNSALQKTLEYLGRRLYSKGELREKLFKKGFGEDSIDYALEKAENFGYLNDEEFAEKFANDKQKLSKWGRKKIEFELHKKGVTFFPKNYDENLEFVNCKSLFDKKIDKIKAKSDFERIRKLKNYLNSRGFEVSTINNVLDQE